MPQDPQNQFLWTGQDYRVPFYGLSTLQQKDGHHGVVEQQYRTLGIVPYFSDPNSLEKNGVLDEN